MSLLPIKIEQTSQILEIFSEDHHLHFFARHYCQNLSQVLCSASAFVSSVYFCKSVIRTF